MQRYVKSMKNFQRLKILVIQPLLNYYKYRSNDLKVQMNELKENEKNYIRLRKLERDKADADLLAGELEAAIKRMK